MVYGRTLQRENREYWSNRAPGYSEVNRQELSTAQRDKWSACLLSEIEKHFTGKSPDEISILEVGTGPGFFAILLAEAGCTVTAIDLTPAMLAEAKKNAGPLAPRIAFREMNAEDLSFADGRFDVIVTRNLTWNLPHPETAYREWCRVLTPGGLLLNFDANWYGYLFDDRAAAAYEADRRSSAQAGVADQNIGENFDRMEAIARRVPLSRTPRPAWDLEQLSALGMTAEADTQVWRRVWSEEEKLNFASTPLFMVWAGKNV